MTAGFDKMISNQKETTFILKNGELVKTVKKGNHVTTYAKSQNI